MLFFLLIHLLRHFVAFNTMAQSIDFATVESIVSTTKQCLSYVLFKRIDLLLSYTWALDDFHQMTIFTRCFVLSVKWHWWFLQQYFFLSIRLRYIFFLWGWWMVLNISAPVNRNVIRYWNRKGLRYDVEKENGKMNGLFWD